LDGDFESWHTEWLKTAKRVHGYADECLSRGHVISAREAYLRAANYYRASEFLLINPDDPRIQTTWGSSKECFRNASKLFPFTVEPIEIPYEDGVSLPGYFYHYDHTEDRGNGTADEIKYDGNASSSKNNNGLKKTGKPHFSSYPTLIVHGGFDSTLEELYSSAAAPALERGYNCLAFEGPGQGGVIRSQKIPFRYDWEKVVTPVIDYATSREKDLGIDPSRMALMGISMGGYLAARAAAFEHRISACVLYNGVYDGYDAVSSSFPEPLLEAMERGDSKLVDGTITALMESDPNMQFNIKHGMWTTGTTSPYELLVGSKYYTTKDILRNIICPTLVLDAEKDDSFPGQPKKVYDGIKPASTSSSSSSSSSTTKKYILFTEEEGAEEHCQCGAPALTNQRIFDWLDETFGYNVSSPKDRFLSTDSAL
jgi:pimeloyl-ACP methyl ester carboxylesterase